jgi:proliferating cell nuclear antigen
MDTSHVALVSFNLSYEGFSSFRCDRPITLGMSMEHLAKILKCA